MAGKYSYVTLWDGKKVTKMLTVTREKGIKMQQILDGVIEPDNEQQAQFVLQIKSIHPSLNRLEGREGRKRELNALEIMDNIEDKFINPGVQQGMSSALPRNDQ